MKQTENLITNFPEGSGKNSRRKLGCVIMASGQSRRFGTNKLFLEFQGKTLLQRILSLTEGDLFAGRVVVTRDQEVRAFCLANGVEVIFHAFPDRNDTVRLGIGAMAEMDGCVFCPCDQPLLRKESLKRLAERFEEKGAGILRLSGQEKQGMPVLFGKEYFHELSELPKKCGGSYLLRMYPEQVEQVAVLDDLELYDIDTRQDYEYLLETLGKTGKKTENFYGTPMNYIL